MQTPRLPGRSQRSMNEMKTQVFYQAPPLWLVQKRLGRMESQARQQKPPRQRSRPQVQRRPPLISQPTAQQCGHPRQLPRLPPLHHGGSTATCVRNWWRRWWRCTRRGRQWLRLPHASASTAPRWRDTSSKQGRHSVLTQPTPPSKSKCGRSMLNSARSSTPLSGWVSVRMLCGRWCGVSEMRSDAARGRPKKLHGQ